MVRAVSWQDDYEDEVNPNVAYTWNGALSNSTTGSACLDYWAKAGAYTNRPQKEVDADMEKIFRENTRNALKIVFGLRMISRKLSDIALEEQVIGYGRRDESYKAIVWLSKNKPNLLYKNLHLIPLFGSWKDFLNEPLISTLDRKFVFELFTKHLNDNLVKKYLPTIRSTKQLRSDRDKARVAWAKAFCEHLGINEKAYRKLKSSGEAHVWQRQMGKKQWNDIDFNTIPGKAFLLHSSQTGKDEKTVFERHNQIDRLSHWVYQQDSIKFTGYPYELTKAASLAKNPSIVQKLIFDRQFETVLEPFRNHSFGNVLACLDTSGSMQDEVMPGVSAYDICLSMGLVFSSLNVGRFKNTVLMFDNKSEVFTLSGSFCTRLHQIESAATAWGSTNFQSAIDEIVRMRKEHPEIPVSEFPNTILCISDMQMNVANNRNSETNYQVAVKKLESVGLHEIRIIWWYVSGKGKDFPAKINDKGVSLIGGFDPNMLKMLIGEEAELSENKSGATKKEKNQAETPVDGMNRWLNQKVFDLLVFESN